MIRIYIIESQTILREGLRTMLSLTYDMQVIGESSNGQEALSILSDTKPDVLLLDQCEPVLDDTCIIKKLSARNILPATIILTTLDDYELLLSSAQAGAKGFLLKDAGLEILLKAIRTVASNGQWFQSEALNIDQHPNQSYSKVDTVELTLKEQEVLRLIASGMSNKKIAQIIDTSSGTIKNYVSNIIFKLEARDRTQAVVKAIKMGLLV